MKQGQRDRSAEPMRTSKVTERSQRHNLKKKPSSRKYEEPELGVVMERMTHAEKSTGLIGKFVGDHVKQANRHTRTIDSSQFLALQQQIAEISSVLSNALAPMKRISRKCCT